jgi:hypothetical protein
MSEINLFLDSSAQIASIIGAPGTFRALLPPFCYPTDDYFAHSIA